MTHGSLFSGIGGFDLAAEWMGWENVFHCEWNPFGQKILKHYWPNAKSYGDITKTDFTEWSGKVDIVSGGFPCQPYSQAGKRKGKADDRHLWPEMLRAIREIQPRWVVGENVPGLLNWQRGMVLKEIETDLENEGFEVFPPIIIPACAKNAPHRRDRLWIIAYSNKIQRVTLGECRAEDKQQRKEKIGGKDWDEFELVGNGTVFTEWRSKGTGCLPEPIFCRGGNGLPGWVDRFESLGNAIVPQVAYEIFKAIDEFERRTNYTT